LVILLVLYIISYFLLIAGANSQYSFLTPLSLAILLLGSLLFWFRSGNSLRQLGFPQGDRRLVRLSPALIIGVLLPFLFAGLLSLTGLADFKSGDMDDFGARQLLALVLVLPFLITTAEELIFRGVFFQESKKWAGSLVSAILVAALWGALHWPAMTDDGASVGQLLLGLLTFLGWGCTLSFAYLLAGRSLWAPIGIHYGYNLASSLIGLLFTSTISGNELFSGSAGWVPETGLIGVVFWLLLALLSGWLVSRRNLLENDPG